MALLQGAAPGTDIVLTEERMASARAFANKVWNAARFLFLKMESCGVAPQIPSGPMLAGAPLEDRWIFSRLNRCAEQTGKAIESFRYHEAAQTLWHFFWHEFCDWYVEMKKLRLADSSGLTPDWINILTAFETALRLLHPAMPFLTEELWQRLGAGGAGHPESIARAAYPRPAPAWRDEEAEQQMELLQDIVVSARNLRAQLQVEPREFVGATLWARAGALTVAEQNAEAIMRLGRVRVTLSDGPAPERGVKRSTPEYELVLDLAPEKAEALKDGLTREISNLEKLVESSRKQLANEQFVSRAPAHVVAGIREKLAEYEARLEKSSATLAGLS
jgi:valyl-tRNA synthetase